MGNVLKSRNMFLDKEEIVQWDNFIFDEGFEQFIKNSVFQPGILRGSNGVIGSNFLPIQGSTYKKITFSQDSLAYNSNGKKISYKHIAGREFDVPYTAGGSRTSYLSLSYNTTHIETGTIYIADGIVTGINTLFTSTLRDQNSLMPHKIRVYLRTISTSFGGDGYDYSLVGTYEVVNVVSNSQIYLASDMSTGAGDYVYSVVGSFSPGTFDDGREEEIYNYDNFSLTFSDSSPTVTGTLFLIASITVNDIAGTMTITDLRYNNLFSVNSKVWIDITSLVTWNSTYFANSYAHYLKYRYLQDGSVEIKARFRLKEDAQDVTLELSKSGGFASCDTMVYAKLIVEDDQGYSTGESGSFTYMGDVIVANNVSGDGITIYIKTPDVIPNLIKYYTFTAKLYSQY